MKLIRFAAVAVLSAAAAFAQTAPPLPPAVQHRTPAPAAGKPFRYTLPDAKGALDINLRDLKIQNIEYRPDGGGMRMLATDGKSVDLTLFLQRLAAPSTAVMVRDREWTDERRDKVLKDWGGKNFRPYQAGNEAFLQYFLPTWEGMPVRQEHLHAYYIVGSMWAEVHISKSNFQAGDQKVFASILDTVHVEPQYTPQSLDLFLIATVHYRAQQYGPAAENYRRALGADVTDKQLGENLWKVATDNLTMSYGQLGQFDQAQRTAESGLLRDPGYAMFYYLLACAHAEKGELDPTLQNLGKAFELKSNVLPGEKLPNPATDESFRKFRTDPKFVALLKKNAPAPAK